MLSMSSRDCHQMVSELALADPNICGFVSTCFRSCSRTFHTIFSQQWKILTTSLVDWQIVYQWPIRKYRSLLGKQVFGDIIRGYPDVGGAEEFMSVDWPELFSPFVKMKPCSFRRDIVNAADEGYG